MSKANKKAAPSPKSATSKTNTRKHTAPPIPGQQYFPGFPPPPLPGEGPLELYLLTRPGWHDRMNLCAALSISDREARAQSEHSAGLVIFGSGTGQGLKHLYHADAWEARQCAAELRCRAFSHLRRAHEIERALREMGVHP
jgi:hypothetical protein